MELEKIPQSIQVVAVVVGVVISVLSFNDAREKESAARTKEAETRRIEALAPFYQLRQERYVEISKVAAILADSEFYNEVEIKEAKKRFRALYIIELSMVESSAVETSMKTFATAVSPDIIPFSEAQSAAYNLSHALRKSFTYER